jgi:WD40 repeat protein
VHLASASDDHTVRIWDASVRRDDQYLSGHNGAVNSIAFCPDRRRLVSAGDDQTVKVWDLVNGGLPVTLETAVKNAGVALSPDGRLIAVAGADGCVSLWDADSGQRKALHPVHEGPVRGIAFSPSGGQFASAGDDQTVKLWELAGAKEPLTLRGHTARVNAVVFSRDGRYLFSAGDDKTVRTWDTATGQELATMPSHNSAVLALAISPDGRWLASGTASVAEAFTIEPGEVRLWDLVAGREVHTFPGQAAGELGLNFRPDVVSLAFSPDGSRLVAAVADGHLKLWEPATGQDVLRLHDHLDQATCVQFSPDGGRLASGGGNGSILVRNGAPLE